MSQQYNKGQKRKRRLLYIKRTKVALKAKLQAKPKAAALAAAPAAA